MKTSIFSQHQEHAAWINKLAFYDDEIVIMQNRISEIAQKNSQKDVLAKVDHFQNQLIIQKKHVDDMRRHIKQDEKALEANVNSNPVASDHRKIEDHTDERNKMDGFELNFGELRAELNRFLAEWM
ncbi:MAG: hypothetical protein JST26_19495 [Bacteroidetes bacterium]|nr:hypothetical protein [Bacteroidota bacterium]